MEAPQGVERTAGDFFSLFFVAARPGESQVTDVVMVSLSNDES